MDEHAQVPYIVYEGTMARMERTIKRLYILIIVSIAVILITNLTWLYWWNQYEYVTETEVHNYEQDGEGINLIGDRNHLNYGPEVHEDESYEVSEEEERQVMPSYSFAPAVEPVDEVTYMSDTEFSRKVHGKKTDDVMAVIDDLMNALSVLNPRLYESVIDRL